MFAALDRRDLDGVKALVARGGVVVCNETSWRVKNAVEEDRLADVAFLLKAGADPDWGWGEFPQHPRLMLIAFDEHVLRGRSVAAMRLLLEHGAEPDQRAHYFWGARRVRADDSDHTFVQFDFDLPDATALIAGAAAGDTEVVRLLLDHGADRTARDQKGNTASDYARKNNDREMLALLATNTGAK